MEEPTSTLTGDQSITDAITPTVETPASGPPIVTIENPSELDRVGNHPATQIVDSKTQACGHDAQPESSISSFEKMFGYTDPSPLSLRVLEEFVDADPLSPQSISADPMGTLPEMSLTSVDDVVESFVRF